MRNFEDIMKDKLYGAESDYSDKIWENVKKEIPITKKSNSRYIWMSAFLFAILSMILMVQQYPNWKVNQESAESFTQVEPLDVSQFILSQADLDSRQVYSSVQKVIPTLRKANEINNEQILSSRSNSLSPNVPTLASTEFAKRKNEKKIISQSTRLSLEQTASRDIFFDTDDSAKISELNDLKVIKEKFEKEAPLYTLATISKFNVGLKIPEYKITANSRNKDNDVHCEVLKGKQSKYYIAGRHVNSYAFNNLKAKGPAAEEYLTSRYASESKKYSFSDEVSFGVEYRSGVFAELGIRYDQINEKFNFYDPNARGTSTFIVSDTIQAGAGSTVIIDTITTELTGLREVVNSNHHKKISVPLSIGYKLPLNKKVSIAGRTGLLLNVWSRYEGKMFDENLEVVSISHRQSSLNPLFNKLVHSVSASAFLQYKMNKRMEFLVGLDGYKNLDSATYESNPLNQKYASLGIFIGTKYNL